MTAFQIPDSARQEIEQQQAQRDAPLPRESVPADSGDRIVKWRLRKTDTEPERIVEAVYSPDEFVLMQEHVHAASRAAAGSTERAAAFNVIDAMHEMKVRLGAMLAPADEFAAPAPSKSEVRALPTRAHARNSDPSTSHVAAAHASRDMTANQAAVLEAFKRCEAMTDVELVEFYGQASDLPQQSESGLRTRRSELVIAGYVEDSGSKKVVSGHDPAIIWRLVEHTAGLF